MILISINILGVIGFDRKGTFPFGDGVSRNIIIVKVDMSSSPHIDNTKKDILILGKGPTQILEHTMTAEKCIQLILLKITKKMCLSLYYNGANSYLLINGIKSY